MLHYFLTGDEASRETALVLAEWIVAMDDGRKTVFRWLSRADTGLASSTASPSYHGPGRGAGHAIAVLLAAHRLSGERRFLEKAEALIGRCIHPSDDLEARRLLDTEQRWSYTVFLQVLGRYLYEKALMNEVDARYAYAQAALLHYARWMASHEYPYLEKSESLQYPTETWAAQDMRKSDVFELAALNSVSDDERAAFLERSGFFFDASIRQLAAMPSRIYTRPLVILLTSGFMHAAFGGDCMPRRLPMPSKRYEHGSPQQFVPQRAIAMRRAKALLAAGAVLTAVILKLLVG
jgi:hypothetical protein